MIGIVAAFAVLSALGSISSIPIPSVAQLRSLAPLGVGILTIASALALQRMTATRRSLASRRSIAVVPADEFDANPSVVLSFAAQLASSERSIGGWRDRRASALRIRLGCDSDGQFAYLIEAPARAQQILRAALRAYEGVEVRSAEEVLGGGSDCEEPRDARLRTELVLAQPSIEPLARPEPDPDPLQPFAAAMVGLRVDQGEQAVVVVDLLPATGRRRSRLRRRLLREARHRHRDKSSLNVEDLLPGPRGTGSSERAQPDQLLERRLVGKALDAKLKDSGPLFEAQILLCCSSPDRSHAKTRMQRLLAAFEPLADRNWLRASGLPIPGLSFLGSDLPIRRRRFDRRLETGFFAPARRSILTARELAGFLKPPTVSCRADNVLRSGALLAPPPPLPTFDPDRSDLIPIGRIAGEDGERLVGVRVADTFFTYIAGRSRYGKTETAIAQFVHLVRSGHGGSFLDPHGDALDRIEPYLAEPEVAARVVRIDLRPDRPLDDLPAWNLFEVAGASPAEREARVEAVVDAFASALEWGERSTRAINLTTQAAASLAAIATRLPRELAPTIFQITTLLSNEEWRAATLPFLPEAQRSFWVDRFPLLSPEAITPITNMVDRMRSSTPIALLFGRSVSTYRAREAMDRKHVVLMCPGAGGARDRLAANLFAFDQFHAARGRADLPPDRRVLFWPFFDEVQAYDGGGSGILAALLEQSAKFGIRATFLNQNPERLSPATLNALLTNRSHLLSSALNSHAAALLAKEWAGQPTPAAVTRLPRFSFIGQVTDAGAASLPFALRGVRAEEVVGDEHAPTSRPSPPQARGASSAQQDLEDLETLDERILAGLRDGGQHDSRPPGPVRLKRRPTSCGPEAAPSESRRRGPGHRETKPKERRS
ncbi:MAG TPA: hypothetical protein VFU11_05055 [Solirubrobacterales bacterium]|nr:hypothetical protein [Solirubrobacterales bacterium]